MKKIPSIFERDWNGDKSKVTSECNPLCVWVFNGEGIPTRKFDGAAVRIKDGKLWARFDAKNGKTPPMWFEPAQPDPDPETGHWPGWIRVNDDDPQYQWHRKAFEYSSAAGSLSDGTYEACGPHFQKNPEGWTTDCLVRHGCETLQDVPLDRAGLVEYLRDKDIEGIVWHHPDGRMAKIKKRDLGLAR